MQAFDDFTEDGRGQTDHLLVLIQVVGFSMNLVHQDSFSALRLQLEVEGEDDDDLVVHEAFEDLHSLRIE